LPFRAVFGTLRQAVEIEKLLMVKIIHEERARVMGLWDKIIVATKGVLKK
jgi:hypothetical protein